MKATPCGEKPAGAPNFRLWQPGPKPTGTGVWRTKITKDTPGLAAADHNVIRMNRSLNRRDRVRHCCESRIQSATAADRHRSSGRRSSGRSRVGFSGRTSPRPHGRGASRLLTPPGGPKHYPPHKAACLGTPCLEAPASSGRHGPFCASFAGWLAPNRCAVKTAAAGLLAPLRNRESGGIC